MFYWWCLPSIDSPVVCSTGTRATSYSSNWLNAMWHITIHPALSTTMHPYSTKQLSPLFLNTLPAKSLLQLNCSSMMVIILWPASNFREGWSVRTSTCSTLICLGFDKLGDILSLKWKHTQTDYKFARFSCCFLAQTKLEI